MAPTPPPGLLSNAPLAPLTTLGLGGPARWLLDAERAVDVVAAFRWAAAEGLDTVVLGGGSNVVVSDDGFDGLVIRPRLRGVARGPDRDRDRKEGPTERVTAAAGEPWDALVEATVAEGLAGLECLSGIPGTVGAAPIQNVGAYGQEVADVLESVRVLDLLDLLDQEGLEERVLPADACELGYRDSRFRRHPGRFVVLSATFRLVPGGAPTLRYPELARAVAAAGGSPDLRTVRETVLALRRSKSMVLDPGDENRRDQRSVGSFFVNPVLAAAEAEWVAERAAALGLVSTPADVPRFPAPSDRRDGTEERVKLSAGWLIEAAGFRRGERRGPVGISSRHALALVHHGGGTTAALLGLAREIRDRVEERFGVRLRPEPVFVGFGEGDPLAG